MQRCRITGAAERPAKWGCWVWGVQLPSPTWTKISSDFHHFVFWIFVLWEFFSIFFLNIFSDFFSLPRKVRMLQHTQHPVPRPLFFREWRRGFREVRCPISPFMRAIHVTGNAKHWLPEIIEKDFQLATTNCHFGCSLAPRSNVKPGRRDGIQLW